MKLNVLNMMKFVDKHKKIIFNTILLLTEKVVYWYNEGKL